ncbi:MAG: 2-aminomuconic 6-semialdehyde dehydrogenase [Bacteroidia bacterium]|jgi:aminomuconate-semialdehyde/2-hydroxymuconate-6-semialdehyde dehydrogenase|nr:MAG: 2-aminomuconic 6-semialdehyde dehydrogenase [Bacteroidia bacterium]
MKKIANYINGRLIEPKSKNYINNYNPATGEIYSLIPDSNDDDVNSAIESAKSAFPYWSKLKNSERSQWLEKISNEIHNQLDELAVAESIDNGKPLKLAKAVDIPRARDNFKFYASAIQHFASESHHTTEGMINFTLRKPVGVAGCISPWNLPLYLFTWKIAPALAAGNTVVAKPSEITPMTAYLLSEICHKIGLPAGVLNIVHGLGSSTGNSIISSDDIDLVSFTGGTSTGAHIAKIVAPKFKKMSLELGGKNPNIIFDDCDFDEAIRTSLNSSFANQGQICLCGSRILVQRGIYEKFKNEFVAQTNKMIVGDPMNDQSRLGAIVSKPHYEKILSYIELAKEEGGSILSGGASVKLAGNLSEGWYIRPTIIEGLDQQCRTNQEEIFGPVVTIQPFDTEEEAIELANSSIYGLAATIWTSDLSKAHRCSENIKSGIIWVNCWLQRDLRTPFGGMKNSGVGREGGWEALRFFTEPKNVCIKY